VLSWMSKAISHWRLEKKSQMTFGSFMICNCLVIHPVFSTAGAIEIFISVLFLEFINGVSLLTFIEGILANLSFIVICFLDGLSASLVVIQMMKSRSSTSSESAHSNTVLLKTLAQDEKTRVSLFLNIGGYFAVLLTKTLYIHGISRYNSAMEDALKDKKDPGKKAEEDVISFERVAAALKKSN